MTDLSKTIAPKSDQLNSDDLISGPRTITITKVSACSASDPQPIAINFEGDNGKPYKPCKSMRRVLVFVWGPDGKEYVGRSITLYRDPSVKFGGIAVGGMRISHMSHIEKQAVMSLTESKQSRKPFTVKPLKNEAPNNANQDMAIPPNREMANGMIKAMEGAQSYEVWNNINSDARFISNLELLAKQSPDFAAEVKSAIGDAKARIDPASQGSDGYGS